MVAVLVGIDVMVAVLVGVGAMVEVGAMVAVSVGVGAIVEVGAMVAGTFTTIWALLAEPNTETPAKVTEVSRGFPK